MGHGLAPTAAACIWLRDRFWVAPATRALLTSVSVLSSSAALGPSRTMRFEAELLSSARLAFLRDHVVAGAAIVPGAALMEAALSSAQTALAPRQSLVGLSLAGVQIMAPLQLQAAAKAGGAPLGASASPSHLLICSVDPAKGSVSLSSSSDHPPPGAATHITRPKLHLTAQTVVVEAAALATLATEAGWKLVAGTLQAPAAASLRARHLLSRQAAEAIPVSRQHQGQQSSVAFSCIDRLPHQAAPEASFSLDPAALDCSFQLAAASRYGIASLGAAAAAAAAAPPLLVPASVACLIPSQQCDDGSGAADGVVPAGGFSRALWGDAEAALRGSLPGGWFAVAIASHPPSSISPLPTRESSRSVEVEAWLLPASRGAGGVRVAGLVAKPLKEGPARLPARGRAAPLASLASPSSSGEAEDDDSGVLYEVMLAADCLHSEAPSGLHTPCGGGMEADDVACLALGAACRGTAGQLGPTEADPSQGLASLLAILQQRAAGASSGSIKRTEVSIPGFRSTHDAAMMVPGRLGGPPCSSFDGMPGLAKTVALECRGQLQATWSQHRPSAIGSRGRGKNLGLLVLDGALPGPQSGKPTAPQGGAAAVLSEYGGISSAGIWFSPTLRAASAGGLASAVQKGSGFRLVPRPPGAISSLIPEPVPSASPADQVAVRVHAVGLNFRDLLVVSGGNGRGSCSVSEI